MYVYATAHANITQHTNIQTIMEFMHALEHTKLMHLTHIFLHICDTYTHICTCTQNIWIFTHHPPDHICHTYQIYHTIKTHKYTYEHS